MPIIKLTKGEQRRYSIFMFCILAAVAGWLLQALSNKYVYPVKTVIRFKDFPHNKAFTPLQSDTIDLQVEGSGWQLLFSSLRISPQSVSISLKNLAKRNYVTFSEQLYEVNKQLLENNQKVVSVKPDTLYFDFSKRSVKRVPIRFVSRINFEKQFGIAAPVELTPNFITITGPQEVLEKIDHWDTDTLRVKNMSTSSVDRIALKPSEYKNVSIFPNLVEVKIPVDEFTEKTVDVPLKIINNQEYYDVKLIPQKARVTFMVSLRDYPNVNQDFIQTSIDLNEWKLKKHTQLDVQVTRFPDFCRIIKIEPAKVDFIVDK